MSRLRCEATELSGSCTSPEPMMSNSSSVPSRTGVSSKGSEYWHAAPLVWAGHLPSFVGVVQGEPVLMHDSVSQVSPSPAQVPAQAVTKRSRICEVYWWPASVSSQSLYGSTGECSRTWWATVSVSTGA